MELPSKRILTLFIVLWFSVLIITQFGIYGLPVPKTYTVVLLLISVFSFIMGFCSYRCNYGRVALGVDCMRQVSRIMNNRIFIVIIIAVVLYLFSLAGIYFEQIQVMSLSEIRTSYYSGSDSIYGRFFGLINHYLLIPFTGILAALFGYGVIFRRDWKLLVIFVLLLVYSMLGGGRFGYLLHFIIPAIFAGYVFRGEKIKLKPKRILSMIIVAVTVFLIFVMITGARRGGADMKDAVELTVKDVLTYANGPVVAFEYSIEHDYPQMIGGYGYGRLTLHAIDDFFVIGLGTLSGVDREYFKPPFDILVDIKQDTPITLGTNFRWNALYTWNLFFYNDLGVLGMIIFPFLIGRIARYVICEFYKYRNFGIFIVALFLFKAIIFSFIDYKMANMMDVLLMVVIFVCSKYKFKFRPVSYNTDNS